MASTGLGLDPIGPQAVAVAPVVQVARAALTLVDRNQAPEPCIWCWGGGPPLQHRTRVTPQRHREALCDRYPPAHATPHVANNQQTCWSKDDSPLKLSTLP
jgi:hypothetical protein